MRRCSDNASGHRHAHAHNLISLRCVVGCRTDERCPIPFSGLWHLGRPPLFAMFCIPHYITPQHILCTVNIISFKTSILSNRSQYYNRWNSY